MKRTGRVSTVAVTVSAAVALAMGAPVSAAPEDDVLVPIIDATGPSSGEVTEPVLTTEVPLPPDPTPPSDTPSFTIDGPATVGADAPTTTTPALTIDQPASVGAPRQVSEPAPIVAGSAGVVAPQAAAPVATPSAAQELPSTGTTEVIWSAIIATVLLAAGVALLLSGRRPSSFDPR